MQSRDIIVTQLKRENAVLQDRIAEQDSTISALKARNAVAGDDAKTVQRVTFADTVASEAYVAYSPMNADSNGNTVDNNVAYANNNYYYYNGCYYDASQNSDVNTGALNQAESVSTPVVSNDRTDDGGNDEFANFTSCNPQSQVANDVDGGFGFEFGAKKNQQVVEQPDSSTQMFGSSEQFSSDVPIPSLTSDTASNEIVSESINKPEREESTPLPQPVTNITCETPSNVLDPKDLKCDPVVNMYKAKLSSMDHVNYMAYRHDKVVYATMCITSGSDESLIVLTRTSEQGLRASKVSDKKVIRKYATSLSDPIVARLLIGKIVPDLYDIEWRKLTVCTCDDDK